MKPSSFHRRPLPPTCISLSSSRGQELFQSAMLNGGTKAFFDLISQYHTQTDPAFCGPSTLVMILNALNVDPRKQWKQGAPWRWYSEEMLNCCIDLETIRKTGITFSTFVCLAKCQGLCADGYYANESNLEEFQSLVQKSCCSSNITTTSEGTGTCSSSSSMSRSEGDVQCQQCNTDMEDSKMYVVVSYNRQVLQQTGTGHFSPIAAYDEASKQVLILDTARFKYTPHWVPIELLFKAMLSIDPETKQSRGFIALSFEPDEKICSASMWSSSPSSSLPSSSSPSFSPSMSPSCLYLPQSLLFRSKRSQNPARRKFKNFLQGYSKKDNDPKHSDSLTFQDIYNYWTDNGEYPRKVWSILEPAPIPIDKEECDTVKLLVFYIRQLLKHAWSQMSHANNTGICLDKVMEEVDDKFVPCSMRTVPITALETIYVIFLSTLTKEDSSRIISTTTTATHHDENACDDTSNSQDGRMDDQNQYITGQILAEAVMIRKAIELSNYQNCSRGGCCSSS